MTTSVTPKSLTLPADTEGVIAHRLGISVAHLGKNTVAYWLSQGKSPQWIAAEVFGVKVSTES